MEVDEAVDNFEDKDDEIEALKKDLEAARRET